MARSPAAWEQGRRRVERSFGRLRHEDRFQAVDIVALREGRETLVRRGTVFHPCLEHGFDDTRRVFRLDILEQFAADRAVLTEAAADADIVAIDRVAFVGHRNALADQSDIADVMLRTAVVTAGEMN